MKWRLLLAVVLDLSILDVASFAQRPPDEERLSSLQGPPQDDKLFSEGGVVRFQLIQGRLGLDAPRHRKGAEEIRSEHHFESISVTAERGVPSLHYICKHSDQQLTLSVEHASHVRIESWRPRTAERSLIDQPEFGSIAWTIERGQIVEHYSGSTLLHVRLQNSALFDMHYGELIERVLCGSSLEEISNQAQQTVMTRLADRSVPTTLDIDQCVAELRSPSRASRMLAQQQLLSWGTPVVPVLQQLLSTDLDPEQVARIKATLRALRPLVEDTPRSLAMLLLNDQQYWTFITPRLDSEARLAANEHLSHVGLPTLERSNQPAARVAKRE
ncbi:hypothetical protein [Novipirellula artificiosorum]|uniref:Secreted protein n=1 Tax=Novipirellula artificiosorum TaxID=2528016 RepID=A0A5C6E336_9BACT|nr:hypothetical protein [Novipirellula artificiosorum]TWU42031.1 hypothetical protein Poly41_03270 [Novipirellula artificiosorum]